jgi:methylmalonyl-CoA/ethylmalonyl-CoA epimerase
MIRIEGLAHIGIRVSDFARSVACYRQFGFRVTREDLDERVVVLRHPGGIELNLLDSADDDNRGRNVLMDEGRRYPGITHIALRVGDVQRAKVELEAAGITITEGPVTFGDGSTSVFFRDPDRNVIELTEPLRGRPSAVGPRDGTRGRQA